MIKIEERIRELSDDPEYQGQRMKILKIIRDEYDIKLEEAKKIIDEVLDDKNMGIISYPNKYNAINIPKTGLNKQSEILGSHKTGMELLKVYKRIRARLDELLSRQDDLNKAIEEVKNVQEKENKIRNKKGIVGNVIGFIGILFLVCCFLAGVGGIIIGFIGCIIIQSIGNAIDKKIVKDKFEKQADEYNTQFVIPAKNKAQELKSLVDQIWETDEMILYEQIIPEEYKELEIMDFFIRALEIGRASNEKELFNLYEEELHRKKVESMQKEMLENQQKQIDTSKEQLKQLDAISREQRHISRQVKYGNVVGTLDLLKKK